MHLLYADDSGGDHHGASDKYFVLGGIAVFERKPYYLSNDVDAIQAKHFPGITDQIEFRASAIWNGNGEPWSSTPRAKRTEVMRDIYSLLANQKNISGVSLFGVALHKEDHKSVAPIQKTCEELAGHFDAYLNALENTTQEKQRGLIIFDQSRHEKAVQALMNQYRTTGASFGRIKRLAEVPLFADSKITRLLQLADFVAYAIYRRYESKDATYFDMILPAFHEGGGIIHGLTHLSSTFKACFCPACMSRRSSTASA